MGYFPVANVATKSLCPVFDFKALKLDHFLAIRFGLLARRVSTIAQESIRRLARSQFVIVKFSHPSMLTKKSNVTVIAM